MTTLRCSLHKIIDVHELVIMISNRVDTYDYADDSNEVQSRLECIKDTVEITDMISGPENLDQDYLFSAYNVHTEESDSNERYLE